MTKDNLSFQDAWPNYAEFPKIAPWMNNYSIIVLVLTPEQHERID